MMRQLQRGAGNAAVARAVMRQATDDAAAAAPTAAGQPAVAAGDATGRLRALIAKIEHLHESVAQVAAMEQDEDAEQHLTAVSAGLAQLRAAASGEDEALKKSVLAGFTSERLAQHEQQLGAGPPAAASGPDAAPSEQVAAPTAAPATVATKQSLARMPTPVGRRMLSRQGAGVMELGWWILATDAEAAPEEAAAGPVGWVIGAGLAVVGLAIVGIGYAMSSAGNVADTGIVNDATALIAAGLAATMCAALDQLMDAAARARDTKRMQKIKATQKAKGCRHSRQS
jgi:hypothetical protein